MSYSHSMINQRKTFSKIYDQCIDKIYRFIFLKVNSKEIAQDLCSETFLKGWESFKTSEKEIENPQAFLYRIARNLVVDHYREKGRTQVVSTDFVSLIDPRINLEKDASLNFDLEQVKTSINKLKDDYQTVVVWYYLEDISVPEIAKMMDKSEQATRVMIHRALKVLKAECNKKPFITS